MIQVLTNKDVVRDISEVSEILNTPYLELPEKKYFACFPKEIAIWN